MTPLEQTELVTAYLRDHGCEQDYVAILPRKSGIPLAGFDPFTRFRELFAGSKATSQYVAGGRRYVTASEDGRIEFQSINYGELGDTHAAPTVVTI